MSQQIKFTKDQLLFFRYNNQIYSGHYSFVRHMKAKGSTPDDLKLKSTEYLINGHWIYEENIKTSMEELI